MNYRYIILFIGIFLTYYMMLNNVPTPTQVKQIRRTIELSSQDETKCLKTQKTKDTFVSTGTYINPLNKTILVEKNVVLLSHGIVQKFNVETQKTTIIYEGKIYDLEACILRTLVMFI